MDKSKQFESKKNNVSKIHEDGSYYVRKQYQDKNRMTKEFEILKYINENTINTPTVSKIDESSIYMEFIEGTLLLEYYVELEKKQEIYYDEFIRTMAMYHKDIYLILDKYEKGLILKDMNFRNYLIKDNQIYRIDYEECQKGKKESDIGKLAAFALTYNPIYTHWKRTFTNHLIKIFSDILHIPQKRIVDEMKLELERIKIRRK